MSEQKKTIKKYWDWRSVSYGLDQDKSVLISERWEKVLREITSDGKNKSALDIGTGRGQFAFYLDRIGFDVTGIDISDQMIYHAQKHAAVNRHDIDFRVGDAESLGFPDGSFDVVVSRNLLWTLPHPEKALMEWKRVLKPGGTLVLSDGFWMNVTWKRLPQAVLKCLRGSRTTIRFFLSYMGVQNSLPLYQGVTFEDARQLMNIAKFKDIKAYDTSRFGLHPYVCSPKPKKGAPSFFIAYAKN